METIAVSVGPVATAWIRWSATVQMNADKLKFEREKLARKMDMAAQTLANTPSKTIKAPGVKSAASPKGSKVPKGVAEN